MLKTKKHIEIVRSTVSCLSSMSQESCASILTILNKHYTNVGVTIVNTLIDLEGLIASRPDLVFLGMEFIPLNLSLGLADPNRIWIAEYLDKYKIAYTGSNEVTHQLSRDKDVAKQLVLEKGLETPPFFVIKQNQSMVEKDLLLTYPLFIKPVNRGGGLGIDSQSVVYNFSQLCWKINSITINYKSDSLVEEYLPGREFSVAILKEENSARFLMMPIELIAPIDKKGVRMLSGRVKSDNSEQAIVVYCVY